MDNGKRILEILFFSLQMCYSAKHLRALSKITFIIYIEARFKKKRNRIERRESPVV